MVDPEFDSSDSIRSRQPLRHAQQIDFDIPLTLELGGALPEISVTFETYGTLNARRDNAVLICHAISGDSHVARHADDDEPGWWDILVGPGKWIDTQRYFVVCQNVLGGCRGTTGPNSINPRSHRPYGADFPAITVADMVEVQRWVIDHLGIETLHAVIGGSLGGHQAITWSIRHPHRIRACVALATSPRLTSQAVAFDVVGRNAIMQDPGYLRGQYYDAERGPDVGLALARMLAHITYLSRDTMTEKFDPGRLKPKDIPTAFEKKFSVGSYLAYQGHKFVERFDANSYVTLSMTMDLFDLGETAEQLRDALAVSSCRWLVISFTSDWLFPPEQSRDIAEALIANNRSVTCCNVETRGGHDSFLLEEKIDIYGGLVRAFLASIDGSAGTSVPAVISARQAGDATSIFHAQRLDYEKLLELIPRDASILDLGCGSGVLLERLRQRGHSRLLGIELDERAILGCAQRGVDVIQRDLERGLSPLTAGQFDVVVLSQTLQSVTQTELILDEMLRVGRLGIVSFPNFAYHKLRKMLADDGRSPKAGGPYSFEWWNTPNRRFPSILDFEDFCERKGIDVQGRVHLDTESDRIVTNEPNLNADVAIFVLSRRATDGLCPPVRSVRAWRRKPDDESSG
ncbi:MAG: homoserine O-acetyltransferase [Deltaproteobacteria bacterium]|nr:homoserine O-acetyltransferase [Deltaproteobacteria bacterium]